jgi:hypothetical protein
MSEMGHFRRFDRAVVGRLMSASARMGRHQARAAEQAAWRPSGKRPTERFRAGRRFA